MRDRAIGNCRRQFVNSWIQSSSRTRSCTRRTAKNHPKVCLTRWRTSLPLTSVFIWRELRAQFREVNLHAMRMGPGKHLKGLTLMNGIVTPEEVRVCRFRELTAYSRSSPKFDYFHELIITQELCRIGARGYGDGMFFCHNHIIVIIHLPHHILYIFSSIYSH